MSDNPVFRYAVLPGFEDVVGASEKKWTSSLADNAGLDVYGALPAAAFSSTEEEDIHLIFRTGLVVAPPPGVHIMVAGRSGNAFKKLVVPFYGIVDASYRGEIRVLESVRFTAWGEDSNACRKLEILHKLFSQAPMKECDFEMAENGARCSAYSEEFYLSEGKTLALEDYTYEEFVKDYGSLVEKISKEVHPTSTAVAQLVFLNYAGIDLTKMRFERVELEDLPESIRGAAGFGSTG